MEETQQKSYRWMWLLVFAAAVILLVLWWTGLLGFAAQSADAYQAVFLTNGQVYFGKLAKAGSQYPELSEVYYLQVTQPLQPKGEDTATAPNVNLVKLGAELHGPTDTMVLNRDHIIFYEDLKSDSAVVTAIVKYKTEQK